MGFEAKKTEHCGPKRGNGAYLGYRWDAKKESNRIRRENWKREIRDEVAGPSPMAQAINHRAQARHFGSHRQIPRHVDPHETD